MDKVKTDPANPVVPPTLAPSESASPTLAPSEPAPPSLVQPLPPPPQTLSQSSAVTPALASAATPGAALAPNAATATDASLSRARALGGSDAHSSTPEPAQAMGAPPPLALPVAPYGSRPTTLTYGRKLTFTQAPYDSPAVDAPYAVKVTMRAHDTMHPASVVFLCSERVDRAGVPVPEGTFKQLRESYLNSDRTAYWLVFDEPALQAGDSFTIILMSARPIRVVNVQEGPSVK